MQKNEVGARFKEGDVILLNAMYNISYGTDRIVVASMKLEALRMLLSTFYINIAQGWPCCKGE